MKLYNAQDIRNIALVGHGSSGKTTLAESMLYIGKTTDRLGKVADGNTVTDCDAEEKKRKVSVTSAVAPYEYEGKKINLIDAPGLFDFECGMYEAIRAAKTTLIVLSCNSGLNVGSEKAFKAAQRRGTSRAFAVTKCERENANFYKVLDQLKAKYGTKICPAVVPVYDDNGKIECYANLITHKAVKYGADNKPIPIDFPEFEQYDELMEVLKESVASADDELMEKFFEGEEFTTEEIRKGLRQCMLEDVAYPVYACDGLTTRAVDMLMTSIVNFFPAAATAEEKATDKDGNEVTLKCDENGPLAAVVFKTIADPFVGKLSLFRIFSGVLTSSSTLYNATKEKNEKAGGMFTLKGNKQTNVDKLHAGDIGALAKLQITSTGDTLCDPNNPILYPTIEFPAPCISKAVFAAKQGEEDKVFSGLNRLAEEDPSIRIEKNPETTETELSGQGEMHLDVIRNKLASKFGANAVLQDPKIPYRETIRKTVKVQGRHKKQTGGHGQFGDVWIEFSPITDSDAEFEFEDAVVGGVVPRNFIPSVEKGLRENIVKGVLAGYPMVHLHAKLYDGSYHPVDSSEMAFKTAARIAYKKGCMEASPVLLEPIMHVDVLVPNEYMGDIMGDMNKRRGRIMGMNQVNGMQQLEAEAPLAEMFKYATDLRSMTQGAGSFTCKFVRYEEAPGNVQQKVIEEAKALAEAE